MTAWAILVVKIFYVTESSRYFGGLPPAMETQFLSFSLLQCSWCCGPLEGSHDRHPPTLFHPSSGGWPVERLVCSHECEHQVTVAMAPRNRKPWNGWLLKSLEQTFKFTVQLWQYFPIFWEQSSQFIFHRSLFGHRPHENVDIGAQNTHSWLSLWFRFRFRRSKTLSRSLLYFRGELTFWFWLRVMAQCLVLSLMEPCALILVVGLSFVVKSKHQKRSIWHQQVWFVTNDQIMYAFFLRIQWITHNISLLFSWILNNMGSKSENIQPKWNICLSWCGILMSQQKACFASQLSITIMSFFFLFLLFFGPCEVRTKSD